MVVDKDFTITKYYGHTKGTVAKLIIEDDICIDGIKDSIEEFRAMDEIQTNNMRA